MFIVSEKLGFLVRVSSGVIATLIVGNNPVAAETILFTYSPFQFSLRVESLEQFAQSGEINPNLAFYLRLTGATEAEKIEFRETLNKTFNINPVRLSRILNTNIGEAFLERVGHIINIQGGRNGKYPLRGALIQSAFFPEGLSLLGFFQNIPVNLEIDVRRAIAFADRIKLVIEATRLFSEETARLSQEEILSSPTVDYSQLPAIHLPGDRQVKKDTWILTDKNRARTFYVDVYYPQGDLPPQTPVVIVSHGLASRPEDFASYGQHLASHGYLVAIPQHPGSDLQQAQMMLEGLSRHLFLTAEFRDRPLDISYVIDELEKRNPTQFQGKLKLDEVGVFGHSFGGYTALALAGATLDFEHLQSECDINRIRGNTSLLLQCIALQLEVKQTEFRDQRVAAVYASNPVNSALFGPRGMSEIDIPVFIGAGNYDPATPFIFEQVLSFPWLTTPNKYLLLQEGQAHVDFSQLDSGVSDLIKSSINVTLPTPQLLRKYADGSVTAFFNTYIREDSQYDIFLQPAYLAYLSQDQEFKAHLITSYSSEALEQQIIEFRRLHRINTAN